MVITISTFECFKRTSFPKIVSYLSHENEFNSTKATFNASCTSQFSRLRHIHFEFLTNNLRVFKGYVCLFTIQRYDVSARLSETFMTAWRYVTDEKHTRKKRFRKIS